MAKTAPMIVGGQAAGALHGRKPPTRELNALGRRIDPVAGVGIGERGDVGPGAAAHVHDPPAGVRHGDPRQQPADDPAAAAEPPVAILDLGMELKLVGAHGSHSAVVPGCS